MVTASLLEVVSIWFKDHAGLRFAIIVNLTLGTLGAVVAATLGWIAAAHIGMETDLKPVLLWHRWLGTAVAIGALIPMALWYRSRSKREGSCWVYRIALWTLSIIDHEPNL